MKRVAFALVCVLFIGIFSSCGGTQKALEQNQILSVINSAGQVISIGDTEAQVMAITGKEYGGAGMDFPDGARRENYMKSPGIYVDYFDDEVVAIRLIGESKWSYVGGLKVGMTKTETEAFFTMEDYPLQETGMVGGVLLAYDEAQAPITFDEEAPYTIRVGYKAQENENGDPVPNGPLMLDIIVIQSNLLY